MDKFQISIWKRTLTTASTQINHRFGSHTTNPTPTPMTRLMKCGTNGLHTLQIVVLVEQVYLSLCILVGLDFFFSYLFGDVCQMMGYFELVFVDVLMLKSLLRMV